MNTLPHNYIGALEGDALLPAVRQKLLKGITVVFEDSIMALASILVSVKQGETGMTQLDGPLAELQRLQEDATERTIFGELKNRDWCVPWLMNDR